MPHYMAPCWFTLDPASLLATSHYDHGQIPELPPGDARPGVLHRRRARHRRRGALAARPLDAARGERRGPERQPALAGQHALRRRPGAAGRPAHAGRRRLGLPRPLPRAGRPHFDADELAFLRHGGPAARRGRAPRAPDGRGRGPRGPAAPGLVVLDEGGRSNRARPAPSAGGRAARRRLGGPGEAAVRVLAVAGRALRSTEGERAPARGGGRAGPVDRGPGDGGSPRRAASSGRRAPCRGHRRGRPPGPDHAAADDRLRADRARAGRHAAGPAAATPRRRSPIGSACPRTRCSSTSRACSRRPACAAGASWSARCSSPTTSRACATTSGARPRTARCSAAPSRPLGWGGLPLAVVRQVRGRASVSISATGMPLRSA